jgi:hypothetical protein
VLSVCRPAHGDEFDQDVSFPRFRVQEIETNLKIGYGVLLADINGDGKPDIVVADATRVVWYENPTWKRRTIIDGLTKPDNVCIAVHDIDGDGQLDLALGADWKGANPAVEGTIQWLRRDKSLDEPWTVYPIGAEPTTHRMRFADVLGTGKPQLLVVPLLGRNSTAKNNWMDSPVRILAYEIPKDPVHDRWVPQVIDERLHVVHNFWPVASRTGRGMYLLTASYEGVCRVARDSPGKWTRTLLGEGNQSNPKSNRGASEVKSGKFKSGAPFVATIEPWHGNQVVIYTPPGETSNGLWQRHVIDEKLRWGHAVWCADVENSGGDWLVVGVRDDLSQKPGERRGVRLYKAVNDAGAHWVRHTVEDGGVAVEDLAAADLNGDGRVDIVAVGRQTHNVRIYWNEGPKGER